MVAPLRRKNTLELTGFSLNDEGFVERGKRDRYEDVLNDALSRRQVRSIAG